MYLLPGLHVGTHAVGAVTMPFHHETVLRICVVRGKLVVFTHTHTQTHIHAHNYTYTQQCLKC